MCGQIFHYTRHLCVTGNVLNGFSI